MATFTRTAGAAVFGAGADLVDVQVSVATPQEGGEPTFRLVGLPDSAVREGRERIRGAVGHGHWFWPGAPVTVNLAPASARKEGASLDLPIALGVLVASGALGPDADAGHLLCVGELTLDGRVRPVRGVLAAAEAARRAGLKAALVPAANAGEAAAVGGLVVHAVRDLPEAAGHVSGAAPLPVHEARAWVPAPWRGDTAVVRGQDHAVRAAWIAAAGGHNLLLQGPPGCGKTLLARLVADLMPPLSREEAVEASRIHSVAGLLDGGLLTRRPFRAPHHTTSLAGLVGGGPLPRPGEVSLAHRGVLFLDEMPEFQRTHLEALRQPIEDGALTVARASGRARFPAEVLLVGACNPCPCGWYGVPGRCRCSPTARHRYEGRISGPLRDRFDMRIEMSPVDPRDLVDRPGPDPFSLADLERARERQAGRFPPEATARAWNARLPPAALPDAAAPDRQARDHLVRLAREQGLSGRGVHRLLRVARTIADLRGAETVEVRDVCEAQALRA